MTIKHEYSEKPAELKDDPSVCSRQTFLRHLALFEIGVLIDEFVARDDPGRDVQPGGVAYERDPQFSPVAIKLGVVALAAAGMERYHGDEKISREIMEQTRRITHTTDGAYTFDTTIYQDNTEPDQIRQVGEDGLDTERYYSNEQLLKLAKEYHALGKSSMTMLVVDCAEIEEPGCAGMAYQDEDLPRIITRPKAAGSNIYSHEIGHLLAPNGLGEGMLHELMMNCRLEDIDGKTVQFYEADTIQKLVSDGCDLVKTDDRTAINEYASTLSVMGDSASYNDSGVEFRPIYSPAELAFLDPRRKVSRVEASPGTYPLSYDTDKQFGIEVSLPEDHVLRTIIPEADTLFFGPAISHIDDDIPFESDDVEKDIKVFATWNNGRGTALLDIALFDKVQRNGNESVIYADEQLDLVAVSGYSNGEYVRFIKLNSSEGAMRLNDARRRTAECNQIAIQQSS